MGLRPPCRVSRPSPSSTFCSPSLRSSLGNGTSSRWSSWGTCSRRRRSAGLPFLRQAAGASAHPSPTRLRGRRRARVPPRRRPGLPARPRRGGDPRGLEAPGRRTPSAGPARLHRGQERLRRCARARAVSWARERGGALPPSPRRAYSHVMADERKPKAGWLERRREAKRVKRARQADCGPRQHEGSGAERATHGWSGGSSGGG